MFGSGKSTLAPSVGEPPQALVEEMRNRGPRAAAAVGNPNLEAAVGGIVRLDPATESQRGRPEFQALVKLYMIRYDGVGGKAAGGAITLGDGYFLTAAHNLMLFKSNGEPAPAKRLKVRYVDRGDRKSRWRRKSKTIKLLHERDFWVPSAYVTATADARPEHDYAVVRLPGVDVRAPSGFLRASQHSDFYRGGVLTPSVNERLKLHTFGFPAKTTAPGFRGSFKTARPYSSSEPIVDDGDANFIRDWAIAYVADTVRGFSGSGVFVETGAADGSGALRLVGVHLGAYPSAEDSRVEPEFNYARIIDRKVVDFVAAHTSSGGVA